MNRSEHDRLLREILADDKIAALRESSLAEMLQVGRQRRRRRVLVSTLGASLAIVMTLLVVSRRHSPGPVNVVPPPAAPKSAGVKMITDQQLLALFPDRSVALVGRPGEQRFVFLDAENQSRASAENGRNGLR
jgi:hypothetical protein